jgi:hypothetical protein
MIMILIFGYQPVSEPAGNPVCFQQEAEHFFSGGRKDWQVNTTPYCEDNKRKNYFLPLPLDAFTMTRFCR